MNNQTSTLLASIKDKAIKLFNWIINPQKEYQNYILTEKARTLSLFLVVIFLIYMIEELISPNFPQVRIIHYLGLVLLIATYLVNRFVNFFFSSRLALITLQIGIFASIYSHSADDPIARLYDLVFTMIIASFLVRAQGVMLVLLINLLGLVLFPVLGPYPEIQFIDIAGPLYLNLISGILIAVYMHFRDNLEKVNTISVPRSEANFNTIIDNSPLGILISEGRSIISIANRAICDLLGYSEEELIGLRVMDLIHPEDKGESNKAFLAFLTSQNSSFEMETRYLTKNGDSIWLKVNSSMIFDDSGLPVYGIALLEDITQRKVQEELILEKQQDLEEAQRIANLGSWTYDADTNEISWSDQIFQIFGYSPDTHLKPVEIFYEHIHPEDKSAYVELLNTHLADQTVDCFEDVQLRIHTKEKELKHLVTSGEFIFDTSGIKTGAKGTLLDISRVIAAEKEVQESKTRFEIIFENSPLGIVMVSPKAHIVQANTAFCEMLGYTESELLDLSLIELTYPEDIEETGKQMRRAMEEGLDRFELKQRIKTKDGTPIWMSYTGTHLHDDQGELSFGIGIIENITHQREAQLALQESIEKFRGFMEQSLDGILLTDQAGKVVEWNQGMETNTGIPSEDTIGKYIWDIQGQILPEDRRNLTSVDELKALYFDYLETNKTDQVQQIGESVIRRTNGENRSIQIASFPIQTEKGILIGSIHRDITDQKAAQTIREELTAELDRSNKELEQFAYIASHDLQEPLRKIQSFGERLTAKYTDGLDERGRDFVLRMQDAANRGQKMVEALLLYSRVTTQGQPFVQTDLSSVLNEVLGDLEIQIDEQGGKVYVGKMPTISADPTQMRQLFQNLISNALKFHPENEPPVVEVQYQNSDPGQVIISVADQGIGFDEAYSEQIFQPFQRLHGRSEYEGSGIGLSVCKKIVERHNGSIWVESQQGVGTTFFISLPVYNQGNLKSN
jgi:PAS domain S-box-containing protein